MEERLDYTDLIVEKEYPIGHITINRPEKRNALAGSTINQLVQAFDDMRIDPEIRVFILKGNGDCFCAGFDQSRPDEGTIQREITKVPKAVEWILPVQQEPWSRISRAASPDLSNPESARIDQRHSRWSAGLWHNPKPSIAQVHSFCLGAGLWLSNECDITYATPNTVFAYPPPRYGSSVVLGILPPWLLGRKKTMEMAFTGKAITAEEAYNFRLINKIIPEDQIEEEVNKLATSIAKIPPITNMFSKRAINNFFDNWGIEQANRFGEALMDMMENSELPGHYFDYFNKIRKHGYREGRRLQVEQYGYPDEITQQEVQRLKSKKEGK